MLDSISFFRIIKTGFLNFWRNLWLSAAATMVMTITLVIFAVLFLMFAITNYSINSIKNSVDVSVYFKTTAMEDQILKVKQQVEQNPKVLQVTYVSSQQVYDDFKAKNANKPEILQSLDELTENPFPATLHVKAVNLSDYPDIASQLSSDQYKDYVSSVNYQNDPKTQVVIDRLDKILRLVVTFGLGLIAVFSLIAILVIFNTIALTIYNRREEVEIMRLVGATNWYIRGPFLTEAFLYSVFSTLIAALLFIPVYMKVLPKVIAFINPAANAFTQNILNYWYLLPVLLVLALILAAISTFLATRKYLKI